jgi:hypothetical protein
LVRAFGMSRPLTCTLVLCEGFLKGLLGCFIVWSETERYG